MDDVPQHDLLGVIHHIMETTQRFYAMIRHISPETRSQAIALHERNMALALQIVRIWLTQEPRTTYTITLPFSREIDMSGNFMEPVPVIPTAAQVTAAVETQVPGDEDTCAICQESVEISTRIIHCGHRFHHNCIQQWFSMNPRCPVCRYDIRDFQPNNHVNTNVPDFESYANSILHPNSR